MAYKTIDETFWTDPDVRALSYKGKFLFLYLVTNPHCHYSGVYYLPEMFIQIETGLPLKEIKASLQDLTKEGFIKYDSRRSVVWIVKMARYQIKGGCSNKNMMDGIANHFKTLHKSPLINDFSQYYNDFGIPLASPLEDPSESLAESGECIKEKDKEKGEGAPSGGAPKGTLSDEDFIQKLKDNPAYKHINFATELAKMDAWLMLPKNKHRKKTGQFIINWLNKIDRPMETGPPADQGGFKLCTATNPMPEGARDSWRHPEAKKISEDRAQCPHCKRIWGT